MMCYVKKLSIFHFFRVLCFSKYAANAPKDKRKTPKTEKTNKMIELQNFNPEATKV